MRSSTSASQACGSTSFNLAVPMRVYNHCRPYAADRDRGTVAGRTGGRTSVGAGMRTALSPEVVRGRPCLRSTIQLDHVHAVYVILLFNLDRFAGPVAVALALSRPNTDVRHLSVAQV